MMITKAPTRLVLAAAFFLLVLALGFAANAGWTTGLDRALESALALRAGQGQDGMIRVWQAVSWSGGGAQRYVIVAALALLLGVWRGWQSGGALVIMALLSNAISGQLKDAFGRPRPDMVPHLDFVNSLSYPSGHATSGALVYLLFALLVPTQRRGVWLAGGALLALLTGLSRIMLGVHWPTDVVGGWLLGTAFALLGVAIMLRLERNA